jgi:hypothetical protein
LEASQAQLSSTSAQLQQLQAAYSAQEDHLARLLLQLEAVEPLLPHEAAAAEAEAAAAAAAAAAHETTTAAIAAAAATREGSASASAVGEAGAEVHAGVSSTGAVGDSSSSHGHVLQGVPVATASTSGLCGCSDAVEMPPSTEVSKLPRVSATENSSMWHLTGLGSSAALQRHSLCEWGSQPATPGMATPAAADCEQLLHQLQAHAEAGSQEQHQQQQQSEESNGVEQHPPAPSQPAPPVQPAISPAAAAAVASQLLVAVRAATAQAAAAEAAQQQLAQELALQHDLHELQQQELAVLKQRLVTSGDEATRLGSLLQSKHQQLQHLHVRVQRQQQEKQELQRQLQQQQQQQLLLQTPPGSSSKASYRPVGYAAAAAAAAASAAVATPAAGSSRPSGAAVQVTSQGQGACRLPSATPAAVVSSNADAVGAVAPCRRSPSPVRSISPVRAATNAAGERDRGMMTRSSDELALRASMDGDVVYAHAEEVSLCGGIHLCVMHLCIAGQCEALKLRQTGAVLSTVEDCLFVRVCVTQLWWLNSASIQSDKHAVMHPTLRSMQQALVVLPSLQSTV